MHLHFRIGEGGCLHLFFLRPGGHFHLAAQFAVHLDDDGLSVGHQCGGIVFRPRMISDQFFSKFLPQLFREMRVNGEIINIKSRVMLLITFAGH